MFLLERIPDPRTLYGKRSFLGVGSSTIKISFILVWYFQTSPSTPTPKSCFDSLMQLVWSLLGLKAHASPQILDDEVQSYRTSLLPLEQLAQSNNKNLSKKTDLAIALYFGGFSVANSLTGVLCWALGWWRAGHALGAAVPTARNSRDLSHMSYWVFLPSFFLWGWYTVSIIFIVTWVVGGNCTSDFEHGTVYEIKGYFAISFAI